MVKRATCAALLAAAAAAPTAGAEEVILVDGKHAEREHDPLAPRRSGTDLPPPGRSSAVGLAVLGRSSAAGRRAVGRVLGAALREDRISRARYRRYRRGFRRGVAVWRRLRGLRRRELGYPLWSLERIALRGRLTRTRMPALFLQLRRNTQYWRVRHPIAARARVRFRGSELLFEYFPGRGLQLHPLASFKRANLIHSRCARRAATGCAHGRLRRLLDEMSRLATRRGPRWIAWEYLFHFGGGSPPWISGMAQATGIQALGRAARLLRRPAYRRVARRALGAFVAGQPSGVLTRGFRGGTHYLQYSFAPRLYIFNAFVQSLIGLHDYAKLTRDRQARHLLRLAEPEARREIPFSDTGAWSRYSYGGRPSTPEYHELLRELLQGMCVRRRGRVWCQYARRYRRYQRQRAR